MEERKTRQTIPDAWASKAICVLCGYKPLVIDHKGSDPDEMKCPRCGLSIVLDDSGQYACISCLPKALQGASTSQWMKVPELVTYLKTAYDTSVKPAQSPFKNISSDDITRVSNEPIINPPLQANDAKDAKEPLVSDEVLKDVVFKAIALNELGNPTWKIRGILKDSAKYTEEQINSALMEIEFRDKTKSNRGTIRIALILGAFMLVCSLLVGAFLLAQSIFSPNIKQANDMANNISNEVSKVRTENPPVLPAQIQTFAPSGVNIINVPTPFITKFPSSITGPSDSSTPAPGSSSKSTGIKRANCPLNSTDAAALFGGNEKNWSFQKQQWVMLDNNGATVSLPDGMTGGYLVVSSGMEIKSVLGPAKIGNIYMIMISCN